MKKQKEQLYAANSSPLKIIYKLSEAYICNDGFCFQNTFILVKDMSYEIILGTPFLTQIYPFYVDKQGVYAKIMKHQFSFKFYHLYNKKIFLFYNHLPLFNK